MKKHKSKIFLILSFLLPFLVINFIAIFLNASYNSTYTLLVSDMQAQYVSLFSFLKRVFEGTESIFYSFSKGMGGSMLGTFAYYLSSPLNILIVFFKNISNFIIFLITLKISICGLTMFVYLKHKFNKSNIIILIFSLCYALCAYNINYYFNIMWLDGVFLLPLIALGIDKLTKNNKSLLYGISLFFALVSNYYIGYMLCIFSLIYFIYQFLIEYKSIENKTKQIINFIITSILSFLSSLFLLLPGILSLTSSNKDLSILSDFNLVFNQNLLDIFSKTYFVSQNYENILNFNRANIYAGIFIIPLLYFYFINKKIKKMNKIYSLLVLFIIILSFSILNLNEIWHGFSMPIGFNYRYSFLFVFFIIILATESLLKIKHIKYKQYILFGLVYAILTYIISITNYSYLKDVYLFISCGFMCFYLIIFYLIVNNKKWKIVLLLVVFIELLLNGYYTLKDFELASNSDYISFSKTIGDEIENYIPKNSEFYRIEKNFTFSNNDPLLIGYSGVDEFLSTINKYKINFLQNNGLEGFDNSVYFGNNSTPLLDSILGIKYYIDEEQYLEYYKIDDFENPILPLKDNINIYENKSSLNLGYMVDEGVLNITSPQTKDTNIFEYQNLILNKMLKEDNNYFNHYKLTKVNDLTYQTYTDDNAYIYLYLSVNKSDKEANVFINQNRIKSFSKDQYVLVRIENKYINQDVTFTVETEDENFFINNIYAVSFNMDVFQDSINQLKQNQLEISKFTSTYILGTISSKESGILFTSILNDDGWSVFVDGKKVDIITILDAFIGIKLEEGIHSIEFKYQTPYLKLGIIISMLSIVTLILYILNQNKILNIVDNIYNKLKVYIMYFVINILIILLIFI
ncbi:MAG: YfhO family protein [Bacilli bacterium]